MVVKKSKKRTFNELTYREVQCANSARRKLLQKTDQKWLKDNDFKNVGWDNIIRLYQKIDEFLAQYALNDSSLEDLFLEADRIGRKYQTDEEIEAFNQQLAKTTSEIEAEIERQFPDTEIEVVDFSGKSARSRKPVKPSKR